MDMGYCRIERVENSYDSVPERREEAAEVNGGRTMESKNDRRSRRRSVSEGRAPQPSRTPFQQQSQHGQNREHNSSLYISPFDDRYAVDDDGYASEDEESSDELYVSASEDRVGHRSDPPYPHTANTTNFNRGERDCRDRVAMPEPTYPRGLSPRPPVLPPPPFHFRPPSPINVQQRRPNSSAATTIPYDRPLSTAPRSRNKATSDAYPHGHATNYVSRRADPEPATWQPHGTGYERVAGEGFTSAANLRPSAHGQYASSSHQPPPLSLPNTFHPRRTSVVAPEQQRTAAAPRDAIPKPRGERDDGDRVRATRARAEAPTRNAYQGSSVRHGREGEERRLSATGANTSSRRQPHSSSSVAPPQYTERDEGQQRQRRGSAAVAPAARERLPSERVVRFDDGAGTTPRPNSNTGPIRREVEVSTTATNAASSSCTPGDVVLGRYDRQGTTDSPGVKPPAYTSEAEVATGNNNNNNNERATSGRVVHHDGDKWKDKYKGRNIAWIWFLGVEVVPGKKGKKRGRW